jgi:hypothetical protein
MMKPVKHGAQCGCNDMAPLKSTLPNNFQESEIF